ncbi:MAG: PspC domain-containing protein [Candidatus Dadabacteria bacterium]|nr:PspC domain-containing protein [Candidatus Dadabacteria bacterium]NIV40906.1 PspC domain-containing protein [Candidatus Dadabacteria bacterium]NIX16156.1 PspC domain-containing protein [Candidatus Dadabacteria bacterium]
MKKLYRSEKNKMLAGVCGGLAEMFDIDPTLVRLGLIFLCLVTALLPITIAYIFGWIIIPTESELSNNS